LQSADPAHTSKDGRTLAITADRVVLACLLAIPFGVTLCYLPYYALGVSGRARHVLHPLLGPSGPVGISFGVVGAAFFLFMWFYPIRKRLPAPRGSSCTSGWVFRCRLSWPCTPAGVSPVSSGSVTPR
jgi:hypothetical protein